MSRAYWGVMYAPTKEFVRSNYNVRLFRTKEDAVAHIATLQSPNLFYPCVVPSWLEPKS